VNRVLGDLVKISVTNTVFSRAHSQNVLSVLNVYKRLFTTI
jgi:hypothetical protein